MIYMAKLGELLSEYQHAGNNASTVCHCLISEQAELCEEMKVVMFLCR